jgi:putative tryptophan/tyrosine transport system substrate-binding protein
MRQLATILMLVLAGTAAASLAQTTDLQTVGILCHCRSNFPALQAFEAGLTELGWQDSGNIRVVRRTSDGDPARLARYAEELVGMKSYVIFAGFTPAAIAVQQHTADIPVVFAGVSDASQIGAASRFNRPEHNFTGLINMNRELMPKRLEILKEAIPGLSVVGYLANPNYGLHEPQLRDMEAAAKRLGVTLVVAEVSNPAGLEGAFDQLTAHGAQGVVVQQDPLFTAQDRRVVALAEAKRLPAIYPLRNYFEAGGFMWYGADLVALFHRAAAYVDKILKGASPAQLPVERPAKLYLTINAKLAQQLGIEIPPSLLARADEVIE